MVTKHTPAKKKTAHRKAAPPNPFAGTLWERLAEIGLRIPEEELAKHPRDGARNLEHYLYGKPKQA